MVTQGGDNSRRSYHNAATAAQNQRSSRVSYTVRKELGEDQDDEDIDMRGTIQFNVTNEFTKSRGIIEEAPEDSTSQNDHDEESEVLSFRKKGALGGQPPSQLQNHAGSQSIISHHTRSQMSSARRPNDRYQRQMNQKSNPSRGKNNDEDDEEDSE